MTAPPFHPGQIYLGWRQAQTGLDPGPPPRRPVPPEPEFLEPGWLAAQRREENRLSRPFLLGCAAGLALVAMTVLLGSLRVLTPALTSLGAAAFTGLAVASGRVVWQGRRHLRACIAAETERTATARAARERQLAADQYEHARRFRQWQARADTYASQPQWHPVALPNGIDRVDVAGGTMAGWSALLTMIGAPRLAAGGEVTVIDLSEGAAAGDLAALAESMGIPPLVWVLPADLPRFDLGIGLPAAELADVLATSVSADLIPGQGHDLARDHAIVGRICEVLGDGARIAQVTAGLRALGQIGDPRDDLRRGLLTTNQLERITGLFGRGAADRVVIERAWALEARLRMLERLGSEPASLPRSRLRVVATGVSGGALGNAALGAYVVVSLTHLLRGARPGQPWRHTLCLAGAEKLPGDVIDRLAGACELTRTGLVLAYRCVPAHVRERLGRGNAALVVMRLGNAEDAKVVSDQIGTQHRFVISQLTDTVAASISDTAGASYTSTVGTADSWSDSLSASRTSGRSRGRGQSRSDLAPFGPRTGSRSRETSQSWGSSESESITIGISENTSWGLTTSRAAGASESLAWTAQRSREFLVEAHELQQLPPSAVIVSYANSGRREVMLADANPAILTLPSATLLSPEEARQAAAAADPPGPPGSWEPPRQPAPGAAGAPRSGVAFAPQSGAAGAPRSGAAGAPRSGAAGARWWRESRAAWGHRAGDAGLGSRQSGSGAVRSPAPGTAPPPRFGVMEPAGGPERGRGWPRPRRPKSTAAGATGGPRAAGTYGAPNDLGGGEPPAPPVSWRAKQGAPPPNLGPPPQPLDWRRGRRRT